VGIFDGQLYDCSGSDTSMGKGVWKVGDGLPTSGSQAISSVTHTIDPASSTNDFYFADLSSTVPGIDTLYTTTSAGGEGVHKYSLVDGAWTLNGSVLLTSVRDLAVATNGSTATIYTTTDTALYRLVDAGGYNAAPTGPFTSILDAAANESFRGVAFA